MDQFLERIEYSELDGVSRGSSPREPIVTGLKAVPFLLGLSCGLSSKPGGGLPAVVVSAAFPTSAPFGHRLGWLGSDTDSDTIALVLVAFPGLLGQLTNGLASFLCS